MEPFLGKTGFEPNPSGKKTVSGSDLSKRKKMKKLYNHSKNQDQDHSDKPDPDIKILIWNRKSAKRRESGNTLDNILKLSKS